MRKQGGSACNKTESLTKDQKSNRHYNKKKRHSLSILKKANAFSLIKEEHPQFVKYLLSDLLQVEGYSETEVAFGLNLPLHFIRKIAEGDCNYVSRNTFLSILSLYARVFCGWCEFKED